MLLKDYVRKTLIETEGKGIDEEAELEEFRTKTKLSSKSSISNRFLIFNF